LFDTTEYFSFYSVFLAIAGIVVGIVLIGGSVVILIFLLKRYRRGKETNATALTPIQSEEKVNANERRTSFLTMPSKLLILFCSSISLFPFPLSFHCCFLMLSNNN
jgi:ABC-type antimicrobial peptide transport system permease subunit